MHTRDLQLKDISNRSPLEQLDAALKGLPVGTDESAVREAVENFDFGRLGFDEDAKAELVGLTTKLGVLTLKQRADAEKASKAQAKAQAKAAGGSTPREAPGGTPRNTSSGTPRAAGAGARVPKGPPARRGAGAAAAEEKKPARVGFGKKAGTDTTPAATKPTAEADGGAKVRPIEVIAPPPSRTATELWDKITRRTDEYYVVAEALLPAYERTLECLLRDAELPLSLLTMAPLMDPMSLHQLALDEHAERYPDDPDPEALPEASVSEVLRARIVCTCGEQIVQLVGRLHKGFTYEGEQLELVRVVNHFAKLNPTHFRHLTCTVRLAHEGKRAFCELQLHHAAVVQYAHPSSLSRGATWHALHTHLCNALHTIS